MAQFTEVMRQARRMCSSFGGECSDKCPLNCVIQVETDCYRNLCICVGGGFEEAYKLIEERVMQWAAKHPEPSYPTWDEWQNRMFPDADVDIVPCTFGSRVRLNCAERTCDECMEQQIPADIAEKLGIKRKEAK